MMNVTIKNLGPIRGNKESIDLTKSFYVFVGENNSGKTYISQLLWTIFNQKIIEKFARKIELSIDFESKIVFDIDKKLIDYILNEYASFLKEELVNTYNVENTPYQNIILGKFSISFDYNFDKVKNSKLRVVSNMIGESDKEFEFFALNKNEGELKVTFEDKDLADFLKNISRRSVSKINAEKPELKKAAFVSVVIQLLLNHSHTTQFLPASRTFYATFYQYIYDIERDKREKDAIKLLELFENRKKNNGKIDMNNLNLFRRPYTRPMNELFEKIYELNKDIEIKPHYPSLVEKITNLMGGDIVMNSIEGLSMIDFQFKISKIDKSLPMYMASSSVNQLTLFYIYLKYWVEEKNNFLMIDEPEENLNPKNQIKLLEILIEFANKNDNKVLITTHSPLLAEALNNYTYLDALQSKYKLDIEEIIEENNLEYISPEISISEEKIGVYFFDGKRIIEYSDDNYGVFFRDFKNVSDAIGKNGRLLTDYIHLKEQEDND